MYSTTEAKSYSKIWILLVSYMFVMRVSAIWEWWYELRLLTKSDF